MKAKVTILGSGTSGGVPIISCDCEVCTSANPKDKRLRTSILIETPTKNIVIDAGPDFRQQMLLNHVNKLDAIFITHGHRDHVGGLDDIRPFNFLQNKRIPIFCDIIAEQMIRDQYSYAFKDIDYEYAPKIDFLTIEDADFKLDDLSVTPITVMHHKLAVKAFRFKNFTYITDAKTIDTANMEKIKGTEILIVNALRPQQHNAHFTTAEALDFVKEINPKRAYFVHMSHHFGKHDDMQKQMPDNVIISYDGLSFEIDV